MFPPGPFPPHGMERAGTIDLGVRLRDALYTQRVISDLARRSLAQHIEAVSKRPDRLQAALPTIDAMLDTWPLGAMIEDARKRWIEGPDGPALAVLARAAEVVASAIGWPRSIDRRWPMPDEAWMRAQIGQYDCVVVPRGPCDGSPATAVALDARLDAMEPVDLPPVIEVHGDELADQLDTLLKGLQAGEYAAVRFGTPVPWDDASQKARTTLRAATPRQAAFEEYGYAGLLVDEAPRWSELLYPAPPGQRGFLCDAIAEGLLVPSLDRDGRVHQVGVIVWNGPHPPMRVVPAAIAVLRELDGVTEATSLARRLDAPVEPIRQMIDQLCDVGAATMV